MTTLGRLRETGALAIGALFLATLQLPGTVALRLALLGLLVIVALGDLPRLRELPRSVLVAIIAWAALALASLASALEPELAAKEIKNEVGYTMAAFAAFFVLAERGQRLAVWLGAFIAATLVLAIVAIVWRFAWPLRFADGPYGGPGTLVTWLVVVLPFLLVGATRGWSGSAPGPLAAAALVVCAAGAWASGNRIVWVIAMIVVALVAWLGGRAGVARAATAAKAWQRRAGVGVAIALLAGGFVATQSERVRTLENDTRVKIWRQAIELAREAPPTGFGMGRGVQRERIGATIDDQNAWHGHNVFIDYAISLGPAGPLVLFALLASLVAAYAREMRAGDRDRRMLAIVGIAVVVGFVLRSLVDDFFYRHNTLLFWSLNGALLGRLAR